MLDQMEPPNEHEETQRGRGRIAWLIGAPIGGLLLGLLIAYIPLDVAEQEYRDSVSTQAVRQALNAPPVYETTTVEKTVTVHPVPGPAEPKPSPPPSPTPAATGAKPDYGAPVRTYCKDRFPTSTELAAYRLCVKQTSGGKVDP